eukprot:5921871-Prymnesium_polylepis.1
MSGAPVLYLDVRERPQLKETNDRTELVQEATQKYEEFCDELISVGLCDTLDSCTLAYFHKILTGSTTSASNGAAEDLKPLPLHEKIRRAQEQLNDHQTTRSGTAPPDSATTSTRHSKHSGPLDFSTDMPAASAAQITHVASYLAKKFLRDAFARLPEEDREERLASGQTPD